MQARLRTRPRSRRCAAAAAGRAARGRRAGTRSRRPSTVRIGNDAAEQCAGEASRGSRRRNRLSSAPSTNRKLARRARSTRRTPRPSGSTTRSSAPRVSSTAGRATSPYSTCRTLSRNVVSTISRPPAPRPNNPTALTCDAPAKTKSGKRLRLDERTDPAPCAIDGVREPERRDAEPERDHGAEAVTEHLPDAIDTTRDERVQGRRCERDGRGPQARCHPRRCALRRRADRPRRAARARTCGAGGRAPRRSSRGRCLLVLSAPLAVIFAALAVRHPVAGGVSAYVREGLGDAAAAVTGGLVRRARCSSAGRQSP